MNFRIYFIHEDGVSYNANNFASSPYSQAIENGAVAAHQVLSNRGLGGLAWEYQLFAMPISSARNKQGFPRLDIGQVPALVFQQRETNLVVGSLLDPNINSANVRDVMAALAPIQRVNSSNEIVQADGQVIPVNEVDYPDSFLPFGIFSGLGWNLNLPNWVYWGISAFSAVQVSDKNASVVKKGFYGTVGALSLLKAVGK